MTQNRSTAVMQRRVEPHDSLDDFPTPPWATRALCEALQTGWDDVQYPKSPAHAASTWHLSCREPAANRGHMVKPLAEYFHNVAASDVHDYGAGFPVQDYLFGPDPDPVDWTITNPPFRLAEQFIERALRTSRKGVAVIVRTAFLEGIGRHDRLFSAVPPARVYQFAERVVMHRGRLAPEGSTATAYCWVVWLQSKRSCDPTEFHWLPPSRPRLERKDDYT